MAEQSGNRAKRGQRARPAQRPDTPETLKADFDEAALIAAAQGGDRDALDRLLRRHADSIFATCLRMVGDAERARDLSQDAMVRLIEALHSYDGRAKFSTWMTRVVMNLCITHHRRERLRRHASLNVSTGQGGDDSGTMPGWARLEQDTEQSPGSNVEQAEMFRRLRIAMDRLDADARAILVLRDVRGFDYAQIGEVLDVPVGTVKSRIFRARAALREIMESLGAPSGAHGSEGGQA
jgi:RNA polymerase sigma-70 factor (ECF subfamily)